ncbi:MAG: GntP family permease [Clostridiales bacterium]|nr:GntP family permease [Clostridiales bacterium]MBS5877541.1 GntP family permease [Clostridiales bacterium]MDU0939742.1 GntP family permease [Clostridiales bacterium]MDU1042108.1 GntP family permease [Clostridiales bacterium]MDU3489844.1 GntP family permease [Clostridiales bacterium]
MTGLPMIFAFIIAIIAMIVMISKLKVHPFLSIMTVSVLLGLVAGIPLVNKTVDNDKVIKGLATVIGEGFAGTFTSIGIVIILGALIGTVLEKTGAALKLADMVIKLVGKNNPVLALELMGYVVSIPVFCDSGFVILNPIRKALVKRTGKSSVAMTVALACGLYISHVLIPPTPGPIAAASTLGIGDNLLMVMGLGALCSIAPLIAGFIYANFIGKRVKADDEADSAEVTRTYEEIVASYGKLPNGFLSLAPIFVPIILMAVSSIVTMNKVKGTGADIVGFVGTPIIALAFGVIFSVFLLAATKKTKDFYYITDETLKTVGPILFVTAAGGVLGKVIASSDIVPFITTHADILSVLGIFFPFILAAVLKTAQGSSTVALTTTAGIVAPLLPVLGLASPIRATLAVMAIGAGAMTVSHANDSYFWVVTNFGSMTPERGYKTQTVATLIMGLATMAEIFILSLFLH